MRGYAAKSSKELVRRNVLQIISRRLVLCILMTALLLLLESPLIYRRFFPKFQAGPLKSLKAVSAKWLDPNSMLIWSLFVRVYYMALLRLRRRFIWPEEYRIAQSV